ncbi:type-4 ice-structuring protein LS-12 [Dicentrarchus labrax]|uniref:Type-4 ice-structuring protein LS-12 n=1 Tax=Dicentrarchus labrax TaxID=13489 RepID=A0A8P4G8J9_DICLA|nr:type-4 ice-structuring protein LS-12 [Dicentrarchus labrax]
MKFSLIVAVVVLALAQGSFAQDVTDLERLGQYFEEMKNKMTQDLTEIINKQDLTSQAQSIQTQLEPLAAQIQEQLKTVASNVEEQIKPMATSMQAQIQPMVDNFQKQVEAIFQKLTEQAKAIGN